MSTCISVICGRCGCLFEHCGCSSPHPLLGPDRHSEHSPTTGRFVPADTPDEQSVHVTPRTPIEVAARVFAIVMEDALKQVEQGADPNTQALKIAEAEFVLIEEAFKIGKAARAKVRSLPIQSS